MAFSFQTSIVTLRLAETSIAKAFLIKAVISNSCLLYRCWGGEGGEGHALRL